MKKGLKMGNSNNYIEYINRNAQTQSQAAFVNDCELKYQNKLKLVADKMSEINGRQIILLAGPSSSGKTTTAKLLSKNLETYSRKVFTISLDDYYKNRADCILDENGSPDYETIYALDLDLLEENLITLINNGRAEKPVFDFMTGNRSLETQKIEIDNDDFVIVEGLHALNPLITRHLPQQDVTKIFVNLNSRIYNKDGKIILNKRNMRFVRRMVRDYKFRNSNVENTLKLWQKVTQGEDKYLFPFQDAADFKINSLHLYEPCVFRDRAVELLSGIDESSEYFDYCKRLSDSIKKFSVVDNNFIPKTSLLREFIG